MCGVGRVAPMGRAELSTLWPQRQYVADAAVAVNDQGNNPGEDKHAGDGEAEPIEIAVKRADAIPEFAAQTELIASQAERLDAADEHRHGNRNARKDEVVVKLGHRVDECPVVSSEH
jgi:hypothetical protein